VGARRCELHRGGTGVDREPLREPGDCILGGDRTYGRDTRGQPHVDAQNNAPLKLSGASLQIPEFAVEIDGTNPPLRLGFGGAKFTEADDANGKPVWSGEVTALFPWQDNQGAISAGLTFADSALSALKLGVSGFRVAIGKTGWDWTGANGSIGFLPQLAFDVGASFEEHTKVAGDPLFQLAGSVKGLQLATDCKNGSNPFEFLLSGNSPPLEQAHIGKLTTTMRFCAYVPSAKDFAFEAGVSSTLNVDLGPAKKLVTATGSATGWFSGTDFNLDGSYDLTLPVIGHISATGVLSSAGYAFCGTYHFITEGFATTNWVEAPQELSSCDFTPYRRTAAGLAIAWHRVSGAHSYLVTVSTGAQTVASVESATTSLLVARTPAVSLTVRIQPRDVMGRAGPVTTVNVD
jgi:hypothetical protein